MRAKSLQETLDQAGVHSSRSDRGPSACGGWVDGRSKRLGFRELQKKGRELVREGGPIRIDALPAAYRAEQVARDAGVCSKCRHTSGCLRCDAQNCLAYFRGLGAKKTGRSKMSPPRPSFYPLLDPKYPLSGTIYPYLRVQGGS